MDRVILHCDMNSFYASVELLEHPELLEMPVAVCGDPESRHGIILAKNDHAKRYGVVTAETIWSAKKKCPDIVFLPAHHDKYKAISKKVNEIYYKYTDQVEAFSIDESWLDVTGSKALFGTGKEIADTLRASIAQELGLTISVGVSYNKIFAKMGSDYKKPNATTVISRESYKEILWPLPVRELFTVGRATADRLNGMGIMTIGDLANADISMLTSKFGKQGEMIHTYANGLDDSPVRQAAERQRIKSVGNGITFRRDLVGREDIKTAVVAISDTVAGRLRKYELKCRGVKVDIKNPSFKTISRQKQLDVATNIAEEIGRTAIELIETSWNEREPIRLITVTGIGITGESEAEQLSFFQISQDTREKEEKLEHAMDSIRERFGSGSITFGSIIKNDIGIELDEIQDI